MLKNGVTAKLFESVQIAQRGEGKFIYVVQRQQECKLRQIQSLFTFITMMSTNKTRYKCRDHKIMVDYNVIGYYCSLSQLLKLHNDFTGIKSIIYDRTNPCNSQKEKRIISDIISAIGPDVSFEIYGHQL